MSEKGDPSRLLIWAIALLDIALFMLAIIGYGYLRHHFQKAETILIGIAYVIVTGATGVWLIGSLIGGVVDEHRRDSRPPSSTGEGGGPSRRT